MIMRQPEHTEQCALFRWAGYQSKRLPELALMFAIPNGGHRHPATAAKLKAEGVKAGIPDICLPVARRWRDMDFHGLWVEMKVGRNKPTANQIWWHMQLAQQGYRVAVCWGWESARDVIDEYLRGG